LVVTAAVGLLAAYLYRGPSIVVNTPVTKLRIDTTGGFAYVSPPAGNNRLEIAYLNDWRHAEDVDGDGRPDEVCNVVQMGTRLKLTKGSIASHEPASFPLPPSREFNLDKAVVTFPALDAANIPLTVGHTGWPSSNSSPGNPNNEADWKDMVPNLREHHAGTTIAPNWRDLVNGRLVLPGGHIKATIPSSPIFRQARFDFKAGNNVKFRKAMTDKTIYTVDVPAATLVVHFSGAASGLTKLVIQPQGNNVELTLTGLHDGSPIPGNGAPLTDFCTFYQLLQPRPSGRDFLVPHYVAASTGGGGGGGSPSPGFFCSGDWF
jgi:hypothetical protein